MPSFSALMDIVKSGQIGEVVHLEGEQSGPSAYRLQKGAWRATRTESPLGAMAARGVHVLGTRQRLKVGHQLHHLALRALLQLVEAFTVSTSASFNE